MFTAISNHNYLTWKSKRTPASSTIGEYTVYATFAGSESYRSSFATTHISVSEAPVVTPPPTSPPGVAG